MSNLTTIFYNLNPNNITIYFIIVMSIFFLIELNSIFKKNLVDFKSIIVSIGILGTFVGIFIGLLKFNILAIKDSIPILLEGLKTAFLTSIVGMFLSIVLSVVQKFKGESEIEEEIQALKQINDNLEPIKNLEILPLVNTKLDSIDTNIKGVSNNIINVETKLDNLISIDENIKKLSNDINSIKDELKNNQNILFEFLEESLNKINFSLDRAIETLAKGATEEIIKALENVIQDFNQNLTEQFGENFKQLNESIKNMIIWQDNYKNSIKEMENAILLSIESIKIADEKLSMMTENYQKIDTIHKNLEKVIITNDNQIKNLEEHLNSLHTLGKNAKLFIDELDKFTNKIKGVISNQSDVLNQLIKDGDEFKKDMQKQLPESLGELNKSLTSLTNKFRDDYNSFLQHMSKIMELSNKL